MSGLVRPIDAAVRFSTLIDPASEICSSPGNGRLKPTSQVVAEGAGRGGTSAGRGGVRGTHGGHPGPLGLVAQPLADERHLTWCRAAAILAGHGGRLRMSFLGFPAIQKRLLQAIDHVKGLGDFFSTWRAITEFLNMGVEHAFRQRPQRPPWPESCPW